MGAIVLTLALVVTAAPDPAEAAASPPIAWQDYDGAQAIPDTTGGIVWPTLSIATGAAAQARTIVAKTEIAVTGTAFVTCELRRIPDNTVLDTTTAMFSVAGVERSTLTLMAAETLPGSTTTSYRLWCTPAPFGGPSGTTASNTILMGIKTIGGNPAMHTMSRSTVDAALPTGGGETPVVGMTVPAGKYLSMVRVEARLESGPGAVVTCRLGYTNVGTGLANFVDEPVQLRVSGSNAAIVSTAGFGFTDSVGTTSRSLYCGMGANGSVIKITAGATVLLRKVTTTIASMNGCGPTLMGTASLFVSEHSRAFACPMTSAYDGGGALLPAGNWAIIGTLPAVATGGSQDIVCRTDNGPAFGFLDQQRVRTSNAAWGSATALGSYTFKQADSPPVEVTHSCTGGTPNSLLLDSSLLFLKV